MIIILIILIMLAIKTIYPETLSIKQRKTEDIPEKKAPFVIDYQSQIKEYLKKQETGNYLNNNISRGTHDKPNYPYIQTL